MTSTDLVKQCFQICSRIPLTMVKSLLLNSALLKIRIPALASTCSYASSIINKVRNPLTVCGIQNNKPYWLVAESVPQQIRDTTNTLHSFVRRIHGSFVSGIHLHFGMCLMISFSNPGTYRNKILRLSSAQFSLAMSTV